jgi:choloylglycine hydrolase
MKNSLQVACLFSLFIVINPLIAFACTGISLKAKDGGVVVARTVEWALSDAQHNKIMIVPRQKTFSGQTPDGYNGKKWTGKYGFVSLTAYGQAYGPDGLNEEGLYVGVYYLPGFAEYAVYESGKADISMSVGDFMQWMLSSFKTVSEVEQSLDEIIVVNVVNEEFGGAALPFHFKISDPSGESIVIEIVNHGEMKVYKPFLGVITNSPTYDWHLTNLRNYLFLSPEPQNNLTIDNFNLTPLGGGSGFMGLPGDFTPPSRFIRAAAFSASARPLENTTEAVFEAFRILDNFNIPLGSLVPVSHIPGDIVSATQITTASDLKEKVFYYHTMWNREIRKIDLKQIDFSAVKEQVIDDDQEKSNRTKDITGFLIGDVQNPANCIGLKGYAWSVVKNQCIRFAEKGTAFFAYNPKTGASDSDEFAYVVISDDKLKAEVFFSFLTDKPIVMDAQHVTEGEIMPVLFENRTELLKIRFYKDVYQILYNNEVRFIHPWSSAEGLGYELKKP